MNHKIFSEKDTSKPYYAVLRLIIDKYDEKAARILFSDYFKLIPAFNKHLFALNKLGFENTITFIKERLNYYKNLNLMLVMNLITRTNEPEKTSFLEVYNQLSSIFGSNHELLEELMENPNQTILEIAMILQLNYKS